MFFQYQSAEVSKKEVRTAIVGCGGIANWKHMPNIQKLPNVKMVAFCDLIRDRAEEAAKKFGVEGAFVCEDYKELLIREDIDVVHVCTPNYAHSFITIDALNAGKHVMCEKPMAMTGSEADAMCDAAKRNNRLLTVGYQCRSYTNTQYLRNLVIEGKLGEIYYFKCPAMRRRGIPGWGVFIDKDQQGGGPLIDIGTHSIDVSLFVTGNYDVDYVVGSSYQKLAKTAFVSNQMGLYDPDKVTTEDAAIGFVKFKNGATLLIEATWALNMPESNVFNYMFCGTKMGAAMTGDTNLTLIGELNGSVFTSEVETNPRMRQYFRDEKLTFEEYEQKQWYSAICNNTELLTKPEQAAVVTKIIEAIYTSSQSGKPVYFGSES